MTINWPVKKLGEVIKSSTRSPQLAPIISGGASLFLLNKIIFSNLEYQRFIWSLCSIILLFISSVVLYYLLSRLEKNKDEYLLGVIGRTVGDVFKRYGQQMAKSNADHAKAEEMNKIMQTIVNLVKSMKNLGDKRYRE